MGNRNLKPPDVPKAVKVVAKGFEILGYWHECF